MAITIDYIIGDSIAAGIAISGFGLKRSGSYGIKSTDEKGISKVGARPDEILKYLDEIGKTKLTSKNVLLSTGASNGPKDITTIKKELEFLQGVGAKVYIIGVSNNPPSNLPDLKGMNTKLEEIAKSFGYKYLGGFTPSSDGVHPEYSKYFKSNIKPVLDSNEQIEQNQTSNNNTGAVLTPTSDKTETAPTPEAPKPIVFDENKIFTFNVETQGVINNKEIGTFSIVPMNPEFDFESYEEEIPLDDEYVEVDYTGDEENETVIDENKIKYLLLQQFKKPDESGAVNTEDDPPSGPISAGGGAKLSPILDLIISHESGGDYEIYNYGSSGSGGIRSSKQSSSYYSTKAIKLTDKTVNEIIALQKSKQMFAVGKYQTIPVTLSSCATKLGIGNNKFDAATQEKIGERLVVGDARPKLTKYLNGKNDGTQSDLENAVQSLGQEFASLPIIWKNKVKWGDVVAGTGNKAYYGGSGPNPDSVDTKVSKVVVCLIKSRIQYSGKKPSFIPSYYKG